MTGEFILSIAIKVTVILAIGLGTLRLLPKSRAAVRHLFLLALFGVVFMLPMAALVVPPVVEISVRSRAAATVPSVLDTHDDASLISSSSARLGISFVLEAPERMSFSSVALIAEAMGFAVALLPLVVGMLETRRVVASARQWRRGEARIERLATEARIRRHVGVRVHDNLPGPVTCGVWHPVILFPADAEQWGDDDFNQAAVHELEHVRRHDWLTDSFARVICAVYWFHPLAWVARQQLRLESERAADDAVVCQGKAVAYANLLLTLAERLATAPRNFVIGMAGHRDLPMRIKAVLDESQARARVGRIPVVTSIGVAAVAALAIGPMVVRAHPQTPEFAVAVLPSAQEPRFEVAAVKASKGDGPTRVTGPSPGRFEATNITLRGLIAAAFGSMARPLADSQIAGGPDWIDSERFHIIAKADVAAPPGRSLLMLRSVLKDRFGLVFHYRTDDRPVYALLRVRRDGSLGPQLRRSSVTEAECDSAIAAHAAGGPPPEGGAVCALRVSTARDVPDDQVPPRVLIGRSATMAQLAERLSGFPALAREVIDRTGLEGRFDFDLRWMPPVGRPDSPDAGASVAAGPSVFQALEQELGLKLDATRGPVPILVIDQVRRPELD